MVWVAVVMAKEDWVNKVAAEGEAAGRLGRATFIGCSELTLVADQYGLLRF